MMKKKQNVAQEYTVRNELAQIVIIAPRDLVFCYLRDACPDGEYSVEGPDTDCTVYRSAGVLHPSSGTVDGVMVDPRNLRECERVFDPAPGMVQDGVAAEQCDACGEPLSAYGGCRNCYGTCLVCGEGMDDGIECPNPRCPG